MLDIKKEGKIIKKQTKKELGEKEIR